MPYQRIVLVVLTLLLTSACSCGDECRTRVVRSPRQTIVAVDLSGSQTPARLRESRVFVDRTIDSLSYGDHFVLMEMNRTGVGGELKQYPDNIPDLEDSTFVSAAAQNALKGKKGAFRTIASMVFDTTGRDRILHTDILATLFTAGQFVRRADNRPTTIILLSDMLQSANGIEMEGLKNMPTREWITGAQTAGTIPDLTGVCIIVVGADASTPAGVTIREFWSEYIKATGATLGPYMLLAPSPAELTCDRTAPTSTATGPGAAPAA